MLLFADNLDAHCYQPVLDIFASANVLVWFVVPGCTGDLIQPIDAGTRWLSVDDNLDKWWEGKLSASEQRIMMTNFLASALDKMLSEEKKEVHIGSFQHRSTGCLIELNNRGALEQPDGEINYSDDYIQPQGLLGKYVVPLRTTTGQVAIGMNVDEVTILVPEEQMNADIIDAVVNEEEEDNDLLGGEGENRELDDSQDVADNEGDLVPGGIE